MEMQSAKRKFDQKCIALFPFLRTVIFLICSLLGFFSYSQVNAVYNQFFMNPYLYNPAYAGVEGHSVIFGLYKQQWSNINGGPTIANVNFHTPLKGGVGFGAMVFNETQGPLNTSWGKVTSSYLLTIDKEHYLRFGMSIGGGTNSVNFSEIDAPTDPAFLNIARNNSFFIGDFGATYHFGHFNVGFSLPNLVTYDVFTVESTSPVKVSPLDNLLAKMNYRGHINDNIAIEPHVLYRYSEIGPDLLEAAVIFHINHIVWTGASYRQDNNFLLHAGFKIKESFALGYAFELGNTDVSSALGPSHEIHIGYHISSKKEHAEHVSSFIKSHRLSAEQRAEKAQLERERRLAALRKSREPQAPEEDDDELTIAQPKAEKPVTTPAAAAKATRTNDFGETEKAVTIEKSLADGTVAPITTWVPADTPEEKWEVDTNAEHKERTSLDGTKEVAVELIRTDEYGTREKVVKWQPIEAQEPVPSISTLTPEEAEPVTPPEPEEEEEEVQEEEVQEEEVQEEEVQEEKVEVEETFTIVETPTESRTPEEIANPDVPIEVKKGNHLLELPGGNYVVAGAFEVFDHAEDFSDDLFQQGFHDTIVGYVSARGYYYVVIFSSQNPSDAVNQRNRFRNSPGLSEIWVLKVNE